MFFNKLILLATFILTVNLCFGAEISQNDAQDRLFLAVSRGDEGSVMMALANHANVYTQSRYNEQVTHIAARNGNVQLMNLLFNYGANVNALSQSYEPLTPLRIAIKHRHTALVRWLLEHGARVNEDDFTYATTEIIELLAKFYFVPTADLWAALEKSGDSAIDEVFVQAAAINNILFLKKWCDSGKISSDILSRAFLIAAIRGNYEAVECMLSYTKNTPVVSLILKYITGLLKSHSLSSFSESAHYRKIKNLLEQNTQSATILPNVSVDTNKRLNPSLGMFLASTPL